MIAEIRAAVVRRLDGAPAPLYPFLPDTADELPCFVVGRPSLVEGSPRAIVAMTVPVFVLGRTIRDDDAQDELDTLAEALFVRCWMPWSDSGAALRLSDLEPAVIDIAGRSTPAYQATIAAEATFCP